MSDSGGLRMPAKLVERAQALVNGTNEGWEPPVARNAATVVMVRDAADGLEIYLQRRVRTMKFAAGMYVFPGGSVDPADIEAANELLGQRPNEFTETIFELTQDRSTGYDTLACRFAAIREVEEETGHQLEDPMQLRYISHWVTPAVEDRRFDTRFYAVELQREQAVIENSDESDDGLWIMPSAALAGYAAGEMAMLPPTVANLASFADMAKIGMKSAQSIEHLATQPIVPILPTPVADPDSESGIRWALTDVRTGEEFASIPTAPAGSESGGVHTSLGD